MSRSKSSVRSRFIGIAVLLLILALLVPALREGDRRLYLLAAGVGGGMILCMLIPARLFMLDRMLLSAALYLCAIGVAALAPGDPDAALLQLLRCAGGMVALIAGAVVVRLVSSSMLTASVSAFLGLLFMTGASLSPGLQLFLSSGSAILLVISFASIVSARGGFLAFLPGAAGTALLLLQGQITGAVILSLTLVLLIWAADGRLFSLLASLVITAGLFFAAFFLHYVGLPDAENAEASLSALVSSGLFGSAEADPGTASFLSGGSLLYPLARHYGLVFTAMTLLMYLPVLLRGAAVAGAARTRFHAVLAMGCTLIIGLQALAAILSAFGLLPLQDASLPLLTASLPDLCVQMFTIGLLCGIAAVNESDLEEDTHLAMLSR